ncbi:FAD-dependent oxidoreductase [Halobacillus sp. ACCC02827]|uniref:NAD(P)/FAD-dependent oxidoreductase n=1 Tax=Halobacillus sp. ACCC02827 TaxID=3052090 RepID=UPI002570339C|nr:FAD-dependent oxidoreductase [Halobacillus sp. ACCC02827]WJE16012.1 FAD-dependent oxidoreductase [Halobacillus sp. ACCC02827]
MKKYIVVGGGVLGASTAYHLAAAGADVKIVDRKDRGQATDAAAGIVCPWLAQRRNKRWYKLVKGGAAYYPELIRRLEADGQTETGYRRVGAIGLHTDEEKLQKTLDRALKRREDAPEMGEVTIISEAETKRLFPPLKEGYKAVHVSGAARVDGRALRDALLASAEKHGAEWIKGEAQLSYDEERVDGVHVNGDFHEADAVLVTAGVWAKDLLEPLGINFLVHPQKAQIVHLKLSEERTEDWPVVMPPNNQYMLSFGAGKLVVGATHETKAGFDPRVTAGGLHYIFDKALDVAPGLYDGTVVETRVGFRPFTPDSLPVFGALPSHAGLYAANGLGASGLTSGPYLGAELARLVLGEQTELDPADFDVQGAIGEK